MRIIRICKNEKCHHSFTPACWECAQRRAKADVRAAMAVRISSKDLFREVEIDIKAGFIACGSLSLTS